MQYRAVRNGRSFNLAVEIDNSTESILSYSAKCIRQKLAIYDAYQEVLLAQWRAAGKRWERPRFRVVFLPPSVERAYHILALAEEAARNKACRVVYAATHAEFVTDPDPFFSPLFLDHAGRWQSLIDLHPTAPYQ